jgi:acetyl-CoA acetyltransferase
VGGFGGVLTEVTTHELGVVTMCIGGGQALAALFRRVS